MCVRPSWKRSAISITRHLFTKHVVQPQERDTLPWRSPHPLCPPFAKAKTARFQTVEHLRNEATQHQSPSLLNTPLQSSLKILCLFPRPHNSPRPVLQHQDDSQLSPTHLLKNPRSRPNDHDDILSPPISKPAPTPQRLGTHHVSLPQHPQNTPLNQPPASARQQHAVALSSQTSAPRQPRLLPNLA